jgi:hypothetical protein
MKRLSELRRVTLRHWQRSHTKGSPEFVWLQTLARFWLDERDCQRIIAPALADAWYERSQWESESRWRWYVRYRLATTIVVASLVAALDRLRHVEPTAVVACVFAGWCGYQQMHVSLAAGAQNHVVFVLLGVVGACGVVAAPSRLLRATAWCLGTVLMLALLVCPVYGTEFDGHRQWLTFRNLNLHVSTLLLPFFVIAISALRRARRWLMLGLVASGCLTSLAMQPDWQAFAIYTAVLLVALVSKPWLWWRWVLGACCLLPLLSMNRSNAQHEPWLVLGTVGLIVAQLAVWVGASRQRHWTHTRSTLLAALVLMTALRSLLHDALPVIGFGGSATVVFFVVIAACIRTATRHAPCS